MWCRWGCCKHVGSPWPKKSRANDVSFGSWWLITEELSPDPFSFLLICLYRQPLHTQQQWMEDMISCLFRTELRQYAQTREHGSLIWLVFSRARAVQLTAGKKKQTKRRYEQEPQQPISENREVSSVTSFSCGVRAHTHTTHTHSREHQPPTSCLTLTAMCVCGALRYRGLPQSRLAHSWTTDVTETEWLGEVETEEEAGGKGERERKRRSKKWRRRLRCWKNQYALSWECVTVCASASVRACACGSVELGGQPKPWAQHSVMHFLSLSALRRLHNTACCARPKLNSCAANTQPSVSRRRGEGFVQGSVCHAPIRDTVSSSIAGLEISPKWKSIANRWIKLPQEIEINKRNRVWVGWNNALAISFCAPLLWNCNH